MAVTCGLRESRGGRGGDGDGMMMVRVMAGKNGDMFVGGSFTSRVWNGQDFVTINDVAWFVGEKQVRALRCMTAHIEDICVFP